MTTQRVRDVDNACELLRSRYLPAASVFCKHECFASPKTKKDLKRYFKIVKTDVYASLLPQDAQDTVMIDAYKVDGLKLTPAQAWRTFRGGMSEGRSTGSRKWFSNHCGGLQALPALEAVMTDTRVIQHAEWAYLRCASLAVLQQLVEGIPSWAQVRDEAHPHLPFWSRIHTALDFIVNFDPDDNDVIECGPPLDSSVKRGATQLSVDLTGYSSDSGCSDVDDVVSCDEWSSPSPKKARRQSAAEATANVTSSVSSSSFSSSLSSSVAPIALTLAATKEEEDEELEEEAKRNEEGKEEGEEETKRMKEKEDGVDNKKFVAESIAAMQEAVKEVESLGQVKQRQEFGQRQSMQPTQYTTQPTEQHFMQPMPCNPSPMQYCTQPMQQMLPQQNHFGQLAQPMMQQFVPQQPMQWCQVMPLQPMRQLYQSMQQQAMQQPVQQYQCMQQQLMQQYCQSIQQQPLMPQYQSMPQQIMQQPVQQCQSVPQPIQQQPVQQQPMMPQYQPMPQQTMYKPVQQCQSMPQPQYQPMPQQAMQQLVQQYQSVPQPIQQQPVQQQPTMPQYQPMPQQTMYQPMQQHSMQPTQQFVPQPVQSTQQQFLQQQYMQPVMYC